MVHGSLGFRSVKRPIYDWILCNVPARIGRPFIEHFLESGRARLSLGGELRIVVIRDLAPLIQEVALAKNWPIKEAAQGPRHTVFALTQNQTPNTTKTSPPTEPDTLYLRDTVQVGGLTLERPFDLGGDDPKRLTSGWPVLLDALPKQAPAKAFCFRSGYGVMPLICQKRWPETKVTAIDRDLLAADFTHRNAEKLGLNGDPLVILETAHFPNILRPASFDLILGEISPSAGEAVAISEIEAIEKALAPGGQALLLTLEKLDREWITPFVKRKKIALNRVIARESYAVLRLSVL